MPVLLQFDEPSVSQCAQVCTYRFLTPINCFANNGATHFVCPMSQALAVDQIEIHRQRPMSQAELEHFVWQAELIGGRCRH